MDQTRSPGARRRAVPTGTVTFLFTDIEGSTRLVQSLGDAGWAPLLERHRALVRAAVASEGGVEVQTDGDGFFVVFERAPAAVAAAVKAQIAIAAEPWPENAPIKVRMGLHTGEGRLDADGGYVGVDVHRAARIGSSAHGGQIVLSDPTRALIVHSLPAGAALVDLGEHRLKDLRVERLTQLRVDGIAGAFPPLRSLDLRPNNLPTQLTSFVGRERELAETAAMLEKHRLLTLSGPGGTGKSRLSLQLAAAVSDRFPDGIWFVALEPIRDPALVAPTIAHVIGIKPTPDRSDIDAIVEQIGKKKVLLILDNFEQVIGAAPVVPQLLRACPELRIVVTSRAALRVYGEHEYPVPGLPAPPDTSRLSPIEKENLPAEVRHPSAKNLNQYEAVRLFIARALAVQPSFSVSNDNAPAIAQICARLHGMPLAIELTAARIKLLSPAQILTRLEHQLQLLTSGSRDLPERQQTLRGAIAWSYDLLEEPARLLMDRLSVFSGGWDLEAAESICGLANPSVDVLDGLQHLVDQSLVRRTDAGGEVRFEMLPTIQEFAAEHLAGRGGADEMEEEHARIFLGRAEAAAAHLNGTDQRQWLDRLERDHDNFRAALDWSTRKLSPEIGVSLGFSLWRFWQKRGHLNEARSRLMALEEATRPLPPLLAARLYEALGGVAYWRADGPAAIRWYDGALEAWRATGDKKELANALYNRAYVDILAMMDGVEAQMSDFNAARSLAQLNEAVDLYRQIGDRSGEGNVLWGIGCHHYFNHRPAEALPWLEQALDVFQSTGDLTMEAWSRHMLAITVMRLGRLQDARKYAQAALKHFHDAGDLAGVTLLLGDLAGIAIAEGDRQRAGRLMGAAHNLRNLTGTGLAGYVEELFDGETRADLLNMEGEMARFETEGRNMPLDTVVAYALGELAQAAG